ncbi:hypothetical protein [Sporosalibacterium faouarense]|uniref:hypothetical protein n=1 Tax=Sporosalibacterium faouarense TaxID=516123 RepID=UPI00141CDC68|nr:hypothetical protein [Sporosalibacterium faouarense]MTI49371.1 hypothetical protein [Bacillota bacterium]
MNIREGILDSLADGGESIIQIEEYLIFLGIHSFRYDIINELKTLLRQNKIYIEYPPSAKGINEIKLDSIKEYWFELTEAGRAEWENIEV